MTKENNEDDYCVYFAILGDYYYVCPEKTINMEESING